MKHLIIGGGAVGLLIAARLSAAGMRTAVATRTVEQAAKLSDRGIELAASSGEAQAVSYAVEACGVWEAQAERLAQGADELAVWLTVKQTQLTEELIIRLAEIVPAGALLLCMQNGIGHIERLERGLPQLAVIPVITTEGALAGANGTSVIHTGHGQLHMGEARAEWARTRQKILLKCLEKAGIPAFLSKEIEGRIYQKLLINSIINPLTALYGIKNGQLPGDPSRLKLMRGLHDETLHIMSAASIACACGSWQSVLEVCRNTAANESSMLKDIQRGRRTEVEWINGGWVRLARKHGLEAPLHQAMCSMIRALEE